MKTWCKNNANGKLKTLISTSDDNNHKVVMHNTFSMYKNNVDVQEYEKSTGFVLEYTTNIKPSDIIEKLRSKNAPDYMIDAMLNDRKSNGHENTIAPDGGVVWFVKRVDGLIVDYQLILVTEAKSQHSAGDSLGGNAIERIHKNIDFVKNYVQYKNDWFPYLVTCHGDDFNPNKNSGPYQYGKLIPNCPKLNTFWFKVNSGEPMWSTIFTPDYSQSSFFTVQDYTNIIENAFKLSINRIIHINGK